MKAEGEEDHNVDGVVERGICDVMRREVTVREREEGTKDLLERRRALKGHV